MANKTKSFIGPTMVTNKIVESLCHGPLARRVNLIREKDRNGVAVYLVFGEERYVDSYIELVESLIKLESKLTYPTRHIVNPAYGY